MPRVVLTGGSSFTGLWIAETLAARGFEVTATVTRAAGAYAGLRAARIARLAQSARIVHEAPVASDRFRTVLAETQADLLAHHGADIPGYRSPDYDPAAGFARNIEGVAEAVGVFARAGGRALLATGTYFEGGEGGGAEAASPYGVSKTMTNAAQARLAADAGLAFGKFVIPSPFGRWEEGRIVWSLMQAWTDGRAGEVRTPDYVRDQLPAPLLARAYGEAAVSVLEAAEPVRFRPSGFVERVGDFARRIGREVGARTGMTCAIVEHPQRDFPEPKRRANDEPTEFAPAEAARFWDDYVAYYDEVRASGALHASAA